MCVYVVCTHLSNTQTTSTSNVCVCRIINRCSSVVQFSWRQFATADDELGGAAAGKSEILEQTSMGFAEPTQDMLDPQSLGTLTGHSAIYCCLISVFDIVDCS